MNFMKIPVSVFLTGFIFFLLFSTSFVHAQEYTGMDYWRNLIPIKKVEKKDQICFALYTVHKNTLKMTVQFYPLAPENSRQVFLEIKKDAKWQRISKGKVRENYYTQGGEFEAKAWHLLFRVEG